MLRLTASSVFAAIAAAILSASVHANSDLPPFDLEKAKSLSAEKRRDYDLVYFNEIETWNLNSNRFDGSGSSIKRRAAFLRMAADGYLPAYAALRLLGIVPAERRDDPAALDMLLQQAEAGDLSAMCAAVTMPAKRSNWRDRDVSKLVERYMRESAEKGHGGCMAWYGGALLLGNLPYIAHDRKAAMPLLLESARQGYYVAAKRLFSIRYLKALQNTFDFTDRPELERALCWGRLAQQHTNWAGLDAFLYTLHEYARAHERPDLVALGDRVDPKRVPITERAVTPDNCIRLEQEG